MVCRLFVGVGECKQVAFGPGTAEDRQTRRQSAAASETHRHGDRRKPRRRCIDLAVIAGQIRAYVADDRWRIAPGGIHKRIELQRRHRGHHRVAKLLAIFPIGLASWTIVARGVIRLGTFEPLPNRRMKHSAFDDLVERLDRRARFG